MLAGLVLVLPLASMADTLTGEVVGIADGDTLTLRGYCDRTGARRIGLGEVSGTVQGCGPCQ